MRTTADHAVPERFEWKSRRSPPGYVERMSRPIPGTRERESAFILVRILGPVEALIGGDRVKLGGALQRRLLAVLAARHGHPVATDELAGALWENELPSTFRLQLYKRVHALREVLGPTVIVTDELGYSLNAETSTTDARRFAEQLTSARSLRSANRLSDAVDAYRCALNTWRGAVLDGLDVPCVRDAVARLDEARAKAIEECRDTEIQQGCGADRIAETMAFALQFPNRERVVGHLMSSLARAGQSAAALELFEQLRIRLSEDGVSRPSEFVAAIRKSVLTESGAPAAVESPMRTTPSFLPADLRTFVGREWAIADVDRVVAESAAVNAVPVVLVTGGAGVGKTAFAVRWAHRVAERFPDGQLFVDLRGFAPEPPVSPDDALERLVRTLGVGTGEVPDERSGRIALYRSLLAGRRMLIVLDDAATESQVRPLLPGGGGCAVVVTSRTELRGLVALDDAHQVVLDQLSEDEAVALITRMLGEPKVAEEPGAVRDLARVCGYLPLAVRVAAANVAGNRERVAAAVARLRAENRLEELEIRGEPVVSAAFEQSCRALPDVAQRLFDLIGLLPRPEFAAHTAVALLGESCETVAVALRALEDSSLVTVSPRGRYRLHELLHLHARDRLPVAERPAGQRRLLEFYLHTADRAADLLCPTTTRQPREPADVAPLEFATVDAAMRWLDDESESITASVRRCAAEGPPGYAWRLADAVHRSLWLTGRAELGRRTAEAALRAAVRERDVLGQAVTHGALGAVRLGSGSGRGEDHLRQSLELFARLDNRAGLCTSLVDLASAVRDDGRPLEAIALLENALAHADVDAVDQRAHVLVLLSVALRDAGRLGDAADRYEQARRLASSRLGLRVSLATSEVAVDTGMLVRGGEVAHELWEFASSDVVHWRMAALASLASWQRAVGDARGVLAHASALLEAAGVNHCGYALMAHLLCGQALAHLGRASEAVVSLERGLALTDGTTHVYESTMLTIALARALRTLGDRESAARLAELAAETARARGFAVLEGQSLTTLAVLDGSASLARQAREVLAPTGHLLAQAESSLVLGEDAAVIFRRYTGHPSHAPVGVLRDADLSGCPYCG